MTKPVLQTRCIGMQPDASGHPLAPMEYVYECSEPPRASFWQRLMGLSWRKKMTLFMIGYLAFIVLRAVIYVFTGADITG